MMNLTSKDCMRLKKASDLQTFGDVLSDLAIPVTKAQVKDLYDIRENSVEDILTALNSSILANSVAGGLMLADDAKKIYSNDKLTAAIRDIEENKETAKAVLQDLVSPIANNASVADILVGYVGDLDMPDKAWKGVRR